MRREISLGLAAQIAREGAAVERCHAHPHALRYSVGHHSLDMITMITLAWQAEHGGALPRAELLVAAAFHDVPERIIGDIPMPSKNVLREVVAPIEDGILRLLGVNVRLTAEEQLWLKIADGVECMIWAFEESVLRGNMAVTDWVEYFEEKYASQDLPTVWHEIITALAQGPRYPLPEPEIMELARGRQ